MPGQRMLKSSTIMEVKVMPQSEAKLPPIHPGYILREDLEDVGIPSNRFAAALGISRQSVKDLLDGKSRITPTTAIRLAIFFGTSDRYWMNLQSSYDLRKTSDATRAKLERSIVRKEQLLRSA